MLPTIGIVDGIGTAYLLSRLGISLNGLSSVLVGVSEYEINMKLIPMM